MPRPRVIPRARNGNRPLRSQRMTPMIQTHATSRSHPPARSPSHPLGLLAGWGRFPIVVAAKAKQLGMPVVCVGIRHHASDELASLCDRFYWAGVARMGRVIRCFRKEGVRTVVMAGKIQKSVIYTPWRIFRLWPDWRTIRFWFFRRRRDNKDDSLLLGMIDGFARDGI